jgi:hypothetical protein
MEMELWNDLDGVTDGYVGGAGWLGTFRRMGKRDTTQPGLFQRLDHHARRTTLPFNSINFPRALPVDQLTETVSPSRRETSTLR